MRQPTSKNPQMISFPWIRASSSTEIAPEPVQRNDLSTRFVCLWKSDENLSIEYRREKQQRKEEGRKEYVVERDLGTWIDLDREKGNCSGAYNLGASGSSRFKRRRHSKERVDLSVEKKARTGYGGIREFRTCRLGVRP